MSSDIDLKGFIRDVPNFPKPGIVFKDITPLLKSEEAFRYVVDVFADRYQSEGVSGVAGIESRGFIFGAPVAYKMGVPYIPVRKPGKLPCKTRRKTYALEYGEDAVEIHEDAVEKGDRILIIDDLLATGGTAAATCGLVEDLGGTVVACAFVVELTFLNGRNLLDGRNVFSLISY